MPSIVDYAAWKRKGTVSGRAVALWSARSYDGVRDCLLDLSGNGLHARLGSAVGVDTNDPVRLVYRGCKEVYCPGSNNNGVVSSGRTISTTTVSERVEISSVDLLTYVGADNCLIGNNSTHQQVRVQSTGVLRYTRYDTTAATFRTADSTVVIPSDAKAVAAEYNGATSVSFYYATTEDLATASWIQFGAAVAITAVATVLASWTPVVGHSTQLLSGTAGTGRVRQARWYRNAVLVDTFDAAALTEPYSSYVDPVGGGTWTLTRSTTGRKLCVVDRDLLLLGTDDYLEVADNPLLDFGAGRPFTLALACRTYGAPSATTWGYIAKWDGGANPGYYYYANPGNEVGIVTDGVNSASAIYGAGPGALAGRQRIVALRRGGGNADFTSVQQSTLAKQNATDPSGDASNAFVLRIGTRSGTTHPLDGEVFAAAIFREKLTDADLLRAVREMGVAS